MMNKAIVFLVLFAFLIEFSASNCFCPDDSFKDPNIPLCIENCIYGYHYANINALGVCVDNRNVFRFYRPNSYPRLCPCESDPFSCVNPREIIVRAHNNVNGEPSESTYVSNEFTEKETNIEFTEKGTVLTMEESIAGNVLCSTIPEIARSLLGTELPQSVVDCCVEHERCYSHCGIPKYSCDMKLRDCLARLTQNTVISNTIASSIVASDCTGWSELQHSACKCDQIPSASLPVTIQTDNKLFLSSFNLLEFSDENSPSAVFLLIDTGNDGKVLLRTISKCFLSVRQINDVSSLCCSENSPTEWTPDLRIDSGTSKVYFKDSSSSYYIAQNGEDVFLSFSKDPIQSLFTIIPATRIIQHGNSVLFYSYANTYLRIGDVNSLTAKQGALSSNCSFIILSNLDGTYSIKTYRNLYIAAEPNGNVVSDRAIVDPWSKWIVESQGIFYYFKSNFYSTYLSVSDLVNLNVVTKVNQTEEAAFRIFFA